MKWILAFAMVLAGVLPAASHAAEAPMGHDMHAMAMMAGACPMSVPSFPHPMSPFEKVACALSCFMQIAVFESFPVALSLSAGVPQKAVTGPVLPLVGIASAVWPEPPRA